MHPALREGPLFTKNIPIFHFFLPKTPPFHFLPTGLSRVFRRRISALDVSSFVGLVPRSQSVVSAVGGGIISVRHSCGDYAANASLQ